VIQRVQRAQSTASMPSLFVIRISWESVTLGAGLTDESGRPIFVASVVATTEGKLALVSGSTAGIRFAIASALANERARAILNGRAPERSMAAE